MNKSSILCLQASKPFTNNSLKSTWELKEKIIKYLKPRVYWFISLKGGHYLFFIRANEVGLQ